MVKAVEITGAIKRRSEPQRRDITYFSENDVWILDTYATRSTGGEICPTCRAAERIGQFRGNNLRMNFPNLVILDENTIGGPEPDGGGLVHPHCRCFLVRLIGEHEEV